MNSLLLTLSALPLLATGQMTAAAQLFPRQNDPAFVGYISGSAGYSDARSCDYPATISTSGSYLQCCDPSATCNFYTACQSNTLLAPSGVSVPCDVNPGLTCNTALVVPSTLAQDGLSYLACWQTELGTGAFSIVQSVQTGAIVPLATSGSALTDSAASVTGATTSTAAAPASGTGTSAAAQTSMAASSSSASSSASSVASATSARGASSATAAATSSSSAAAASGNGLGVGSGVVGWLLTLALSCL